MYGFHMLVSLLCSRDIHDTQCGFKLFSRNTAQLIFPPLHIERWSFDIELIILSKYNNILVKEVGVNWHEVDGSKLSVINASFSMLRELICIRFCYLFGIWKCSDNY